MAALSLDQATETYNLVRNAAFAGFIQDKMSNEDQIFHGSKTRSQPPSAEERNLTWLYSQVADEVKTAIEFKRDDRTLSYSGQNFAAGLATLYQAVVAIASLGAGFVFTVIFSDIKAPSGTSPSDTDEVVDYMRTCLIVGWLLFVVGIGCSTIGSILVTLWKNEIIEEYGKDEYWYQSGLQVAIAGSLFVLLLVLLGAFLAVALAIRPYNNAIGIAALTLISLMGVGPGAFFAVHLLTP